MSRTGACCEKKRIVDTGLTMRLQSRQRNGKHCGRPVHFVVAFDVCLVTLAVFCGCCYAGQTLIFFLFFSSTISLFRTSHHGRPQAWARGHFLLEEGTCPMEGAKLFLMQPQIVFLQTSLLTKTGVAGSWNVRIFGSSDEQICGRQPAVEYMCGGGKIFRGRYGRDVLSDPSHLGWVLCHSIKQ